MDLRKNEKNKNIYKNLVIKSNFLKYIFIIIYVLLLY